jgi:hypothetical protein
MRLPCGFRFEGWTIWFAGYIMGDQKISFWERRMSHKKRERAKELDRRRQRREVRLKQRIREAKAAAKSKS